MQRAACDRAIDAPPDPGRAGHHTRHALPAPRVTKKPRDNDPRFEIRTPRHQLTGGVDLAQIDGVAPYTALELVSEMART